MPNIEKYMTPRLKMIASLIPHTRVLCDIGTDHGYISIYVAQNQIAKKVIATDIKEGPLSMAKKNFELFGLSDKIETRLSDGFSAIDENEADCAVIAGMGGETVISILEKEKNPSYFVIQMQSAHKELRRYLSSHNFSIEKEAICREGRKMYTALLAKKGISEELTDIQAEIGPYLIKHRPPLFCDYVRYRLHETEVVLKNISSHPSAKERKEHFLYLKKEYEKLLV